VGGCLAPTTKLKNKLGVYIMALVRSIRIGEGFKISGSNVTLRPFINPNDDRSIHLMVEWEDTATRTYEMELSEDTGIGYDLWDIAVVVNRIEGGTVRFIILTDADQVRDLRPLIECVTDVTTTEDVVENDFLLDAGCSFRTELYEVGILQGMNGARYLKVIDLGVEDRVVTVNFINDDEWNNFGDYDICVNDGKNSSNYVVSMRKANGEGRRPYPVRVVTQKPRR